MLRSRRPSIQFGRATAASEKASTATILYYSGRAKRPFRDNFVYTTLISDFKMLRTFARGSAVATRVANGVQVQTLMVRSMATRQAFTKDHEYVKVDGKVGTCGITDFAQTQLGDVVYVSLPEVGATFKKGYVVEKLALSILAYTPTPRR